MAGHLLRSRGAAQPGACAAGQQRLRQSAAHGVQPCESLATQPDWIVCSVHWRQPDLATDICQASHGKADLREAEAVVSLKLRG